MDKSHADIRENEILSGSVGIYCKYNPFSVLDTDYCHKFSSITTGFIVTF